MSGPSVITSILDTDLYKLTMQKAIFVHFPTQEVEYKFYNRSASTMKFSRESFEAFQQQVQALSQISLTSDELSWLQTTCPYFSSSYLSFLAALRLDPANQVEATFVPQPEFGEEMGDIEIIIKGKWVETILYEVPLMAILSESYFQHVDTNWSIDQTFNLAKQKSLSLLSLGVVFSEFGTRRRRSSAVHKLVLEGLIAGEKEYLASGGKGGKLNGTSNVHYAMVFGLNPVGTIAHEWIMGLAALKGYEVANPLALDLWEEVYPPSPLSPLHIALTDTLSTPIFFRTAFTSQRAQAWKGLRQDSGDPLLYLQRTHRVYRELGVSMKDKVVVFSDGLDLEMVQKIEEEGRRLEGEDGEMGGGGVKRSYGVGTWLTNDFEKKVGEGKSKALNIVIKLSKIDGKDCIKISDEISKNTGNADTVRDVKELLGLTNGDKK
ncbi:Quinolinate phosphoribosyl transferase [Mrakia frigida]|uniref:nicotinate phosphoribosyltransferase n=1 Tax=Mrakia frigida TaxID=29902 RepID=UPI003FCBFF02